MNISISSEIDSLQSIIIHNPGIEHNFITPDHLNEWILKDNKLVHNPNYLLFDDIINVRKAIEEHKCLADVLKIFIGENNCIEVNTLLANILEDNNIKNNLIKECLQLENSLYKINNYKDKTKRLIELSNQEIITTLLTGFDDDNNPYFQHPIPNLIFTRDIAAVIGETLVLTWGKRAVRRRENIISKYIFSYHDLFRKIKIYDFHKHHPGLTIEGGDILILDDNIVCLGISERTHKDTINALLPVIFDEGFNKIYAIDLPKCRSIMHLDTIFNRINVNEAIVYPPLFLENTSNRNNINVYSITKSQKLEDGIISNKNLIDIIKNDNIHLNPIKCGGDLKRNQIREQWTEGANFFTIKPGIIIGYECNNFTIESLQNSGYLHVSSKTFLNNTKKYEHISKLVITIPSSELSRGRGGTRCLTLPLSRSTK